MVRDGNFTGGGVDDGTGSRPSDVLEERETKQNETMRQRVGHDWVRTPSRSPRLTTGGPSLGSIQTAAPAGQLTPRMEFRGRHTLM